MRYQLIIIFQLILLTSIGFAQAPEIKNLVLEGAGIRGIAYAGVYQSLEENGLAEHIEKVGGTSAGAIMSLLIALGYSSPEMDSVISNTDFEKLDRKSVV